MKWTKMLFLTLCIVNFSFAQEEIMNSINDQIEIVESYIDSDVFSLDPEEFLDHVADHGAELNGYYEHDRLKKIVKKIGMRKAMVITIFHFWNDQLIHVNYKQKQYMKKRNDYGETAVDYEHSFVKFESNYYYHKSQEIKKEVIGSPVQGIEPEENFVSYSLKMKSLLDNKFKNKNTYEALQGKWVNSEASGEYMIFDETIRFNFRDGKFLKRLKVMIKDDTMYCSSPKDEYMYRYKIESLDAYELVLKDLQNLSFDLSFYRKAE